MMRTLSPETDTRKSAYCNFCGRVLGMGFNFNCHICGATYCYIHMTRHSGAHAPKVAVQHPSS